MRILGTGSVQEILNDRFHFRRNLPLVVLKIMPAGDHPSLGADLAGVVEDNGTIPAKRDSAGAGTRCDRETARVKGLKW